MGQEKIMWKIKPPLTAIQILPMTVNSRPPGFKDVRLFIEHLYVQKQYEVDPTRMRNELSYIQKSWATTMSPSLDDLYDLYMLWVRRITEHFGNQDSTQPLTKDEFVRNLKEMRVKILRGHERKVMLEEWIRIESPRDFKPELNVRL